MSQKTKRIILAVAIIQVFVTVALFVLPRVVRVLPGVYYVRLQNHPLTASIMELVTTPIPASLPAPVAAASQPAAANLPDIPGLPDAGTVGSATATATAQATATPEATAATTTDPTVAPTDTPVPTQTPTPAPPPSQIQLEGVGILKQGFNNCGPANLTIVLNYFGNNTTQEDAAAYLKPNREDRNVSPWQISDYVNDFTALRSTVHSGGDLETVKRLVAAGLPVVIEKGYQPNSREGWYGHYLTVYGYDDAKQEIYSKDTNSGPFDGRPRVDDYEEFRHWWQQFNYTFYVVYEPDQEELVQTIIPSRLQDEQEMWEYAVAVAEEEIEADPEDAFAWFNLGVSLTRLGERDESGQGNYYQKGAEAFDQARSIGLPPRTLYYEHRPFMAYWKTGRLEDVLELADTMLATPGGRYVEEIFWYQGHALAAQGRLTEARAAYERALEVNENFYPAQLSLDWVHSLLNV
jgi:tetratricopeptide (TPR) repeat protein